MKIYKVIFARNTIMSCQAVNNKVDIAGEYYYEHDKGKLIYALIKAETEADAIGKANEIIQKFKEK